MFNPFSKKQIPITVGMQLSTDAIALLMLDSANKNNAKVTGYFNCSVDENSSIEKLNRQVKDYIADKNVSHTACCLVLDDKDYQLLVVDPPNVPEEEIAEAVKWKIKDLIQFPVADAVVDVFLQEDKHVADKRIANVVVVHKDLIEKKTEFIESIGLHLAAIDIPELSYRNYFEHTDYAEKNIALVSVKPDSGKLVVIQKGEVLFSRGFSINYKGGLFDDIPESEIVLELQRSLDYYERQLKQVMPSIIVFIGDCITEDKITDITKSSLNQEVVVESVQLTEGFNLSEEYALASARVMAVYGASLRQNLASGCSP